LFGAEKASMLTTTVQFHRTPVLIMSLLGSVMITSCEPTDPAHAPSAPQVDVARPLISQITDWDEFTGRLEAVQSVEVRARVNGYLESVDFDEGSIVQEGDPLYVIDPRPYQAVLDGAQADVQRAQVTLDLANSELSRAERLFKTKALSEEVLDERTQTQRQADASLSRARATLQSAKLNLEFTRVTAPISGRISRTLVTRGNLVSGGTSGASLLTTIVSMDPIYFSFTGNEREYLHYLRLDREGLRPSSHNTGNAVRLKLSDETGFLHEGTMDFVDNRIDQDSGTIAGRAVFDNPDSVLVPGMFARIQLIGEGPYDATLVPDAAIGRDQAERFVYVVGPDNKASRRTVEAGRMEGGLRIIRAGLKADDRVIVGGVQRVRDGADVTTNEVTLNSDGSTSTGKGT
jgi:multidrug efflux system membrane fusion protein